MKLFCLSFLAMSFMACASNKASGRWTPYEGCGEEQCRSWNSACEADCLNQSTRKNMVDANTCTAQCGEKMAACKQSCTKVGG